MAINNYKRGDSTKLSANFRVSEFLCKGTSCCTHGQIDDKLVEILQKIRDHFGKPVHISSAYRCAKWNKAVGGVSNSYHCYGQAADIKVDDTAPAEVAKYAESIGVKGIGLYETDKDGHFVHIDTRTKKSFWYGQGQERRTTFGGSERKDVCTVELPVLRKGDKGESVIALQTLLVGYGYKLENNGKVYSPDGIFGDATEKALKSYQKANGIGADGICGEKTWSEFLGV